MGDNMKQQATVMVVDDNPLNRSLMEAMLLPEGYDVCLCDSGEACLAAVRQKAPDIILLDAIMPELDGFEVSRQLKTDDETRVIPIVMVTSLSDTADRIKALDSGADDFLSKPVDEVELLARVRSLAKIKSNHDQLAESERRYRHLVQDANVIIFIMNSQGKIVFMNDYGLSFFGFSAEELLGKTEMETILPEYESTGRNLKKISEEFMMNPQLYQRYTHENITKLRRRVWVDWTNRCVENLETGEKETICVGIDVTAAKRTEQERLRLYTRRKICETLNESIHRHLSQSETFGELQQFGVALEPPFVMIVLSIPDEYLPEHASDMDWLERQHRIDQLIDFLHNSKLGIACQTPKGIVIVQSLSVFLSRTRSLSVDNVKLAVKDLLKKVSGYWLVKDVSVGVSHSAYAEQEFADLYEQAFAALQYGPALDTGRKVHHWHDLGCFQFLVGNLQSAQVKQFIQDHLGLVLNEKRTERRAEDLAMLEAIVSGETFQVIADRFHVHKQTVLFRKKKLEEILGVDLDVMETRMNLSIAIKLLSFLT